MTIFANEFNEFLCECLAIVAAERSQVIVAPSPVVIVDEIVDSVSVDVNSSHEGF